ncbi:MAG: phytoene desaturase family protein [Aureispira sp.]
MSEIVARSKYDVIIIGAGIAGMTAAALLSRSGLSVAVLEKEPHAGGYLAGFRRKDFRFDSAIHWLNQCGERGIVTKVFQLIGEDRPRPKSLTRIYRNKGEGHDYVLTNDPDVLKAQFIRDFPHEKAGIEKFFKAAQKIAKTWDLHAENFRTTDTMTALDKLSHGFKKMAFIKPLFRYIWYHGEEGVPKGLNLFFKDPALHRYWASEHDLLSCLFPIAWAYINDYQLPPTGGSQVFIEWLAHVVTSYNNHLIYGATVEDILLENGKAVGAAFEYKGKRHEVRAPQVIAACDVELLYERLLPPDVIPQRLKDNLKAAELYSSAVAISIALDCPPEELGFAEELILIQAGGIKRAEHDSGNPHTTAISIIPPSLRDQSLAPDGKGTLTIYSSAHMDYKENWGCTIDAQGKYVRTEAYYAIKEEFAATILDRIEKRLKIDLRAHILFMDVASPITHWRYSYNRGGSIMGARPGRANMEGKIAHYKTPVEGLILGGHWADLGGGVPIAVKSAANASLIVLQKQRPAIFKTLARYADGKIDITAVQEAAVLAPYANDWSSQPTPADLQRQKK